MISRFTTGTLASCTSEPPHKESKGVAYLRRPAAQRKAPNTLPGFGAESPRGRVLQLLTRFVPPDRCGGTHSANAEAPRGWPTPCDRSPHATGGNATCIGGTRRRKRVGGGS